MEGEVRQADAEHGGLRRGGKRAERERREDDAEEGRKREEDARDDVEATQRDDAGDADREPRGKARQDAVEGYSRVFFDRRWSAAGR